MSERFFDGMLRVYDATLKWVLRHRPATMAVLVLTFVLTAYLFAIIPKGFIPTEDNGTIFAFTETAQDISFEAMVEKQRAVAEIVRQDPSVVQLMSFIGATGSSTVLNNIGMVYWLLGELQKALENLNQALQIRRAVGDRNGEAVTLNNIGLVHRSLGETQKALEVLKEAVPSIQNCSPTRGSTPTS